jgi:lipopolysaccharide export system protein LptA
MRALLPALLGLLLPLAAAGQPIDLSGGGPVDVTARGGFEWRQDDQEVIATGDARAVRGNVTVLADRLVAHYRKKGTGPTGAAGLAPPAPPPQGQAAGGLGENDAEGGNEVYRLDAEGHVRILTPTDEAVGDKAVYDIDQAVLVMTGKALKLTTPQHVMTARDSMEWWSQKHMGVGRGNAVVVTSDGRRVAADVLVAYTSDPNAPAPPGATPAAAKPAEGAPPADPLVAASGKLQRVEAFGNVELRSAQGDVVRGDRGVYVAETGMARVIGHVRITHGDNQANGPAADINMRTGIAHLVSAPQQRVEGLIMPNTAQQAGQPAGAAPATPKSGAKP